MYIPVKNFVDLVWVKEDLFFKGNQITQNPIKTIYLGWLELNHPEVYNSFKKLARLKGQDLAIAVRPELEEYPILSKYEGERLGSGRKTIVHLKDQEKEFARIAEEMFRDELKQTDLGLLYQKHKKFEDYQSYLDLWELPSLNSTDYYPNQMSKESKIFFHLMIDDRARAAELIKTKFFKKYGYVPSETVLDDSLIDLKHEVKKKFGLPIQKGKKSKTLLQV